MQLSSPLRFFTYCGIRRRSLAAGCPNRYTGRNSEDCLVDDPLKACPHHHTLSSERAAMNIAMTPYLSTLIAAFGSEQLFVGPTQAAPPLRGARPSADHCRNNTLIQDWHSRQAIEAHGFFFDIIGDQA